MPLYLYGRYPSSNFVLSLFFSAFEIFKVIHSVVDCEEAIVMAACDVVKEFSADNVQYLELRTTPRANTDSGMTKRSYVDAVVRGIQLALPSCTNDIQVRLLLSIDRRQNITEAYDTIKLAMEHRNTGGAGQASVVGIDLSGDPMV
ncbi:PREDICTED: adenosine deaminase-like protein [Amphimedon queenslandica]|uniref:Adenosine deaminase domain-containing protein n=2 Tax=Amphimedon queenslandica TaxID=400682 RepID=A0AAN0IU90_AMPQE|nr:PREDICTED: adenosine deaminase-like protein [Amphimedon queenslandica]|eukprot:XP_011409237.2 PREDICTED: adenosine deaminase-like protein [Amphimedon queenslandica]